MKNDFQLSIEKIQKLCEAGGMAPSGGNIQPWIVVVNKNILELKLDSSRAGEFLDIEYFASILSLGSFVENLCITANSLGLIYDEEILEFKDLNDPVYRITFQKEREIYEDSLYQYIPKRLTNRKFYDGKIIPEKDIDELKKIVKEKNVQCQLHTLYQVEDKKQIADILGKADVIRNKNEKLFTQMMNEMRWSTEEAEKTRDGMDIKTLELPANADKMLILLKKFPKMVNVLPIKAMEDQAKPLLIGCSHLCILNLSGKPDYKKMFFAGRALERLWLEVTQKDIAMQPWTVLPFFMIRAEHYPGTGFSQKEEAEIKGLGKNLRKLFSINDKDTPLFIFRLSRAKPPSLRSLRRNWRDYTEILS